MKIYVGNLSYQATEDELRGAFEVYGEVASATILKDKLTGSSRGFGFVEMSNPAEAQAAITALNGKEMRGRKLVVNEARPRTEGDRGRDRRSGGGQRSW